MVTYYNPNVKYDRPWTKCEMALVYSGLSDGALRLYLHLVYRAGDNGECKPSYADMQESLCVSRGTIGRALTELEDACIIERQKQSDQAGQKTNRYKFPTPEFWTLPAQSKKLHKQPKPESHRRTSTNAELGMVRTPNSP